MRLDQLVASRPSQSRLAARHDVVCPPQSAFEVRRGLPHAEVVIDRGTATMLGMLHVYCDEHFITSAQRCGMSSRHGGLWSSNG